MKRKSIYLLLLICSLSLISFARQRCCCGKCVHASVVSESRNSEAGAEEIKRGFDLSPVDFFVLNM